MPENLVQELCKKGTIRNIPSFLPEAIQMLVLCGSQAYGVSSGDSDWDILGFAIQDKKLIFPHLQGVIPGFGQQGQKFDQWTAQGKDGFFDQSAAGGKGRHYDFCIFGVIKYFQLLMDANPTQLETLFVPERCVLWSTPIAEHIRRNRKLFLSKKLYHTLFGYAFQQMKKLTSPERGEQKLRDLEVSLGIPHGMTLEQAQDFYNRQEDFITEFGCTVEEFKYYLDLYQSCVEKSSRFEQNKILNIDTKFAYHIIRLCLQAQDVMTTGDMDLEKHREILKSVRRGEWTAEQIGEFLKSKESQLSELYSATSGPLPHKPDEGKIKELLLEVLEMRFGNISKAVTKTGLEEKLIGDIRELMLNYEINKMAEESLELQK